jgi:hypothetical protein
MKFFKRKILEIIIVLIIPLSYIQTGTDILIVACGELVPIEFYPVPVIIEFSPYGNHMKLFAEYEIKCESESVTTEDCEI